MVSNVSCAKSGCEKLPPVDLCSGFLTVLFLGVLCARTLNSGEMKLQKPVDRMYAASNVFDQTCLAPNLLTLSDCNWIDGSFGISNDKEMSCLNCISNDKEMSSQDLDPVDARDFQQKGEDTSFVIPKFAFTITWMPLQQHASPHLYGIETKRGRCPPVSSYKERLK